jgi:hypothetical protein
MLVIGMFCISACTKSGPTIGGNNGQGGGQNGSSGGSGGSNPSSTITVQNNSLTPAAVTISGQTQTAAAGGTVVFTGTPNASVTATATTSGTTNTGTQVGLQIAWSFTAAFPAAGSNFNEALNVGSNYFFLKLVNTSAYQLLKVYVNYGLTAQTLDNITVQNDGNTYNIGYYQAYSNSNVRAENGNIYWQWQTLNLPFTTNQSTTLQAN